MNTSYSTYVKHFPEKLQNGYPFCGIYIHIATRSYALLAIFPWNLLPHFDYSGNPCYVYNYSDFFTDKLASPGP